MNFTKNKFTDQLPDRLMHCMANTRNVPLRCACWAAVVSSNWKQSYNSFTGQLATSPIGYFYRKIICFALCIRAVVLPFKNKSHRRLPWCLRASIPLMAAKWCATLVSASPLDGHYKPTGLVCRHRDCYRCPSDHGQCTVAVTSLNSCQSNGLTMMILINSLFQFLSVDSLF